MTKPRILVVEDNPITRKLTRVTLEKFGYEVVEAPDGRTAMAEVNRAPPDLILSDLRLLDMNGLELCRRMRATFAGKPVPILAVTGSLELFEQGSHAESGFNEILVKPVEPSQLVRRVQAHLAR